MMGDQVGSGGADRRLGGAQRMYGTERDRLLIYTTLDVFHQEKSCCSVTGPSLYACLSWLMAKLLAGRRRLMEEVSPRVSAEYDGRLADSLFHLPRGPLPECGVTILSILDSHCLRRHLR